MLSRWFSFFSVRTSEQSAATLTSIMVRIRIPRLILFPFFILLAILTPFVLLNLAVYRIIVQFMARRFCWNFDSIVNDLDAYFLVDQPHIKPHFSLVPTFTIAGQLDVVQFKHKFMAAVEPRTDPGTRRLFQYPVRFGGYHFWKCAKEFNIDEHIVELGAPGILGTGAAAAAAGSIDSIYEFIARELRTPYLERKPMWKITLIPGACIKGEDPSTTLLVFRAHHSIMDATSFIEFIETRLMQPAPVPAQVHMQQQQGQTSSETRIVNPNLVPILSPQEKLKLTAAQERQGSSSRPYQFSTLRQVYTELRSLNDTNIFLDAKRDNAKHRILDVVKKGLDMDVEKNPTMTTALASDWIVGSTPNFVLSELKPVRDAFHVSSTALFLTVIAGGLQAYMRRYVSENQRPANLHFLNPFRPPDGGAGRPKRTMCNYFTMATLDMNLQSTYVQQRAQQMHTEFQRSSNSSFPILGFHALKLLALLPTWLQAYAAKIGNFTCIFSNISGSSGRWNFFGHEVTDLRTPLPLPNNNQAFAFILVSYNGKFRIIVTADRCCIPTQSRMDELCQLISAELSSLLVQYSRHS